MRKYKCTADYIQELTTGMKRHFTAYNTYQLVRLSNLGIILINNDNEEHLIWSDDIEYYFELKFVYGK